MKKEQSERRFNLPELEEEVLKFWEDNKIFEQTLEKTAKGKPFVFYEGPPTANGLPGVHHVAARAFKDIMLRYKTMRGFFVRRKAGWDTHGLPVEIEVEKKLGFKTKQDIERYGIAKFNEEAKKSVWQYKEEWERLTKRMGYWIDLENPYITYETPYIESLWWIIKEFWKKGLLEEDFKVMPWCTRCQTGLSTHEIGQGYKEVKDTAVYVKFQLKPGQKIGNFTTDAHTYILSWTTTPWTLPGNVALAVNPELEYTYTRASRKFGGDAGKKPYYIFAQSLTQRLSDKLGSFMPPHGFIRGSDLVGAQYEPLFDIPELKTDTSYRVYPADFVSADEGTGVVHTAVMYGEDDYRLGAKVGLPKFHTVDEGGRFIESFGDKLRGQYVKNKETEDILLSALKEKHALIITESYEHDYPHCWRCSTPLLYYARKGWWVKTTKVKDKLLKNNETINWIPEHTKHGRFGEFLRDVRDWAFSRERYWGTPLPIWKCSSCEHTELIGSLEELREKTGDCRNRYIIMRHAEALSNIRKIATRKQNGFPLTLHGKTQAARAAKKLAKEAIDVIYSSPILRARSTARITAKYLGIRDVRVDERLQEINTGIFDGKPNIKYHSHFATILEKFTKRPPGGESLADVRSRALLFLQEVEQRHEGKTILIVSHDYPLWMLRTGALGYSDEQSVVMMNRGAKKENFLPFASPLSLDYPVLPRNASGEVDLHRPFVDGLAWPCKTCGSTMKRVPEVTDVWFDSGAMPFAQAHFPFACVQLPASSFQLPACWKKLSFPADYISEAVDQTRGWFYTLLVVATLLGKGAPYRNVISLGHVLDKHGQKMSKSKGNAVNPGEEIAKFGADTLRWYFYTINPPGEPKRFDEKDLQIRLRGFLGTFWNSFKLFSTYVKKAESPPSPTCASPKASARRGLRRTSGRRNAASKNVLDVWILAKTHQLVETVTEKLEAYDVTSAARLIEEFAVSNFSQWYLRRSRTRFQRPESKQEKEEAAVTTAFVLDVLCRVSAPFAPFIAEGVYRQLRKKTGAQEISVHLTEWPKIPSQISNLKSQNILKEMEEVRHIVAHALKLRSEGGIKVRQPLANFQFPISNFQTKKELLDLIKEEINVKEITFGKEVMLDTVITPELREEGFVREFARNIQEMRRDAGLKPAQTAQCMVSGSYELEDILGRWQDQIKKDTNMKELKIGGKKVFKVERESEIDGKPLWIGISY